MNINRSFISEVVVGAVLSGTLLVLLYAQQAWMPGMLTMLALLGVASLFTAFGVFVWKERGGDEREALHRLAADRIAFLSGGAILIVGIVTETLMYYQPNPWLVYALIGMVLGKMLGRVYSSVRH